MTPNLERGMIDSALVRPSEDTAPGGRCSLITEYGECAFADDEYYCEICGSVPAEKHHWIRTRGSGGGDEPWNILWLCRRHHVEAHAMGRDTFFEQYRGRLPRWRIAQWLKRRGDLP